MECTESNIIIELLVNSESKESSLCTSSGEVKIFRLKEELSPGEYKISSRATDVAGNVSLSDELIVYIEAEAVNATRELEVLEGDKDRELTKAVISNVDQIYQGSLPLLVVATTSGLYMTTTILSNGVVSGLTALTRVGVLLGLIVPRKKGIGG